MLNSHSQHPINHVKEFLQSQSVNRLLPDHYLKTDFLFSLLCFLYNFCLSKVVVYLCVVLFIYLYFQEDVFD